MIKREISVIILNDKNQILLQKRSENKRSYPNMLVLCTGHVEENESFEEAAIRELKEELGVNIKFDELYGYIYVFINDGNFKNEPVGPFLKIIKKWIQYFVLKFIIKIMKIIMK